MADFAVWATAAERGLGWAEGAFMAAYAENRAGAVETSLEADPLAGAIVGKRPSEKTRAPLGSE